MGEFLQMNGFKTTHLPANSDHDAISTFIKRNLERKFPAGITLEEIAVTYQNGTMAQDQSVVSNDWVMGHRLTFHQKGCVNPHGHDYRLELKFDENLTDQIRSSIAGEIYQKVLAPYVYGFLCFKGDKLVKPFLERNGFNHTVVPFETTAEAILQHLLPGIRQVLGDYAAHLQEARLYETARSAVILR